MTTPTFHVLGFSPSTVSMLVETVVRLHGPATVYVIRNMEMASPVPAYGVDGVSISLEEHASWDFSKPLRPLIGVYRPRIKESVSAFFEVRYGVRVGSYRRLIHPAAELATTAELGAGVTVQPQSVLAPYCEVGALATINRSVSVGHHTVIGDLCTLNPGVNVAGRCHLGTGVTVGMGANVLDGVTIGEHSVVGAGALVTGDLPANVLAVGLPATVVRQLGRDDSRSDES